MILGSVGVGLAAPAKRLVKLAPCFVLSGGRPHRLDHVLHRARQRSHLVSLRALTLKSRAFLRGSVCQSGRGGIAAAVIRESAPAARTGNRKKRSFQKKPLGLTGTGGRRARKRGRRECQARSILRSARRIAATGLKPVYGLPDAHISRIRLESSISRCGATEFWARRHQALPARRAGGPAPKVHWSM